MNNVNRRFRDSLNTATRRARETRDAAGKAVQDTAQKVDDATVSSAEKLGDVAASSIGLAQGVTQDFLNGTAAIANHLQQLPADVVDKMFPECPVPMFILPTGPNPEEYFIVFGFDEVFDNLKSGIFVRPKIEAWAARVNGWDIEHLGGEIKGEFTQQFDESRERLVRSGEVDIRKLESQIERSSKEMSGKLGGAASSLVKTPVWLGVAGLALNPVTWRLSLIFLGLALSNGTKVLRLAGEYLGAMSERGDAKRNLRQRERKLEELEAEFDGKNEAFQKAVSNIEVKAHPRLQTLHRLICDKDGLAYQPRDAGPITGDIPDARPYLENRGFQNRLPRRYRNLLKSV